MSILGPATVRMVTSGPPPAALPLHVPPGHQIHQIVDEYGALKHLVLSPQNAEPGSVAPGTMQMINMTVSYFYFFIRSSQV